jgi:hypothetical protein
MNNLSLTLSGKPQIEELMKHVRDLTLKKEISNKDYTLLFNPDVKNFGAGDTVNIIINAVGLLAPYLILYFTRRGEESDKHYIKIEYEIPGVNGAKIKINREFKSDKELAAFLESISVPQHTPSA